MFQFKFKSKEGNEFEFKFSPGFWMFALKGIVSASHFFSGLF